MFITSTHNKNRPEAYAGTAAADMACALLGAVPPPAMPPPTDDAALTRPPPLRYTLTPAFSSNTGPVVVLMSGWPDQPATLYAGLLSRLVAAGYRPALVELPGFPPPLVAPLPPRWWGWDTPQVVAGYAAAVRAIQAAAAAAPAAVGGTAAGAGAGAAPTPPPAPPVTFVTHDWGAAMTWRLVEAHPDVAAAIVGADVGDVGRIRSPAMLLFCALYMSVLAALFVVGGPVGDAGTRWVARLLGAPHPEAAAARMNALYFWTVRGQISAAVRRVTGGAGGGRGRGGRVAGGAGEGRHSPARSPRKDVPPACPVLYLYGERKKVRVVRAGAGAGGKDPGQWLRWGVCSVAALVGMLAARTRSDLVRLFFLFACRVCGWRHEHPAATNQRRAACPARCGDLCVHVPAALLWSWPPLVVVWPTLRFAPHRAVNTTRPSGSPPCARAPTVGWCPSTTRIGSWPGPPPTCTKRWSWSGWRAPLGAAHLRRRRRTVRPRRRRRRRRQRRRSPVSPRRSFEGQRGCHCRAPHPAGI